MAGTTRRLFWQLITAIMLTGAAAASQGQADNSTQSAKTDTPNDVIISTPNVDSTLPELPPDKFTDCTKKGPGGANSSDLIQSAICQHEINGEKRIVIKACLNRDGKGAPS